MIRVWVRIGVYLVVLVLLQVLVLNSIHLFHIVTPFIYIYLILKLPVDLSRTSIIIVSFFLGFAVDIFSDTLGMHAAACSLAGFLRPPLIERFINLRDIPEQSIPSFGLFGYFGFIRFAILLVTIHHVLFFVIEAFTFFQPLSMLIRMALSILFSLVLILVVEAFNPEKKKSSE
jgi:rod shape-determining protein MreD